MTDRKENSPPPPSAKRIESPQEQSESKVHKRKAIESPQDPRLSCVPIKG